MVPVVSQTGVVGSSSGSISTVIATPSENQFSSKQGVAVSVGTDTDTHHRQEQRPSIAPPRPNQMTLVEAVGMLIV